MARGIKQIHRVNGAVFPDKEMNNMIVPKIVLDSIKKYYSKNICERCSGFVVTDYPQLVFSSDGGDGGMLIGTRHCLACGDIIDPVIILNRYLQNYKNNLTVEKNRRFKTV